MQTAATSSGVTGDFRQQFTKEHVQSCAQHSRQRDRSMGQLIVVAVFAGREYTHVGGLLTYAAMDMARHTPLRI
ncbi:hypothetical protein SDC9_148165 [bioreactor metagenome]|uniref:Uncharacterized protein n=1 Tax=bioreactor metagenome TaxID=1076179 RepID=A0A645EGU3_9ZZZZ